MNILDYKRCGVVILWIGDKILLSERLKGKYAGYFGVAGGKIEDGEYVLDGVRREFQEEAGAYLAAASVQFLDCYILPKAKQKVFIFESFHSANFKDYIVDTEPEKHGKWHLYTVQQALKLQLMPYIREYLENFDPAKKFPKN